MEAWFERAQVGKMTNHWQDIYINHPETYDQLVRGEDYQSNLLPAIEAICEIEAKRIVEFGAGTGRLTRLLAPVVERIHAFDLTLPMLRVAKQGLERSRCDQWTLAQADNRAMPLRSACADLAIEGWSFLQMRSSNQKIWRHAMGRALSEMQRVVKPGGTAILIETLGTGKTEPHIQQDWFGETFHYFEKEWGFTRTWIRTDMLYESAEQAREMIRFFFGEEAAVAMVSPDSNIVPECTGLWWKRV
jgi:ubiquinone/menaquinone biosynthesis C-methylase UbiE